MATYSVSSAGELAQALQGASGGDEILLKAGSYGALQLDGYNPGGVVTIRSADGERGAQFSQIDINNSSNVTIENVEVSYPNSVGDQSALGLVSVEGSRNIEIRDSDIHSSLSTTPKGGRGLMVADSDDVVFADNDVHHIGKGGVFSTSSDVSIVGNTFDYVRSDTMQVVALKDSLIENNVGARHYYPGSGDHVDFIQFTGGNSSDVTIRGNVSLLETIANVQGIFLDDATYTNIHIENNIIATGMARGISINAGSGNVATNNTVVHLEGTTASKASIVGGALTSTDNIYVNWQDSSANEVISLDYEYSKYFVGVPDGGKLGLTIDDFAPVKGSPAETTGAFARIEELLTGIVTPPDNNAPPDAAADTFFTDEDVAILLDVLANDKDPDGDVLSVVSVTDPTHGTAALNADGTISYTPDADFVGTDTFSYVVRDPDGETDQATVSVSVAAVGGEDLPPVVRDDSLTTTADKPLTFDVLANDSDPDGGDLRLESVTDPSGGTLTELSDGRLVYTPAQGFSGTDSFRYTVVDDEGNTASGSVSITVQPPTTDGGGDGGSNADTVLLDQSRDFDGRVGSALVMAHDSALEIASGTLEMTFQADRLTSRQGLFSKDGYGYEAGGHFTILLEDGSLYVRLQDTKADYIIKTADIIETGTTHHLAVTFGDEGMTLWVDGVDVGSNDYTGGLLGNKDAIVVGANQWGSKSDVLLQDPFEGSIGRVALYGEVLSESQIKELAGSDPTNTNGAPVAGDDGVSTPFGQAVTFDVLANDTDPDGDTLSIDTFTSPSHGSVVSNDDGSFTYTPTTGFSGSDVFYYTVSDDAGRQDTARVSINVAADTTEPPSGLVFEEGSSVFGGNVGDAIIADHQDTYALSAGTLLLDFTADELSARQGLLTKDAYSYGEGGHLSMLIEDDDLRIRLQDEGNDYEIRVDNAVDAGVEHQLALSFGPDGMSVWLDGAVVGTNDYTGGLEMNAEPFVIGANQWASNAETADKVQDPFDGTIHHLALYDDVLGNDAIAEMFT